MVHFDEPGTGPVVVYNGCGGVGGGDVLEFDGIATIAVLSQRYPRLLGVDIRVYWVARVVRLPVIARHVNCVNDQGCCVTID